MKLLFWNSVEAYNEINFNITLEEMKLTFKKTTIYDFTDMGDRSFYRTFIKTHTKCEVIVKNIVETFNV